MLSKDRVDGFIRKPLDEGFTRSEQMEMAAELLSLREQLAELKALCPVAWQSVSTSSCNRMVTLHKEMAKDWERKGFAVMPLFTAAKPAEG